MTVLSKDQATVMSILWFLLNWSIAGSSGSRRNLPEH